MMSSMRRLVLLSSLLLATAASAAMQSLIVPVTADSTVAPRSTEIDYALADWRRLRGGGGGYGFNDYAGFILSNPGWPGESAMRRAAEKAMRPGEAAATVLAFFQSTPPVTANGSARLAEALAASGRSAEALAAARSALAGADLDPVDEASLMERFSGQLTFADFDKRIDALLIARKPDDAARMWNWASPTRKPAFTVRIALQNRAPDVEAQFAAVAPQLATDAGLLMDRVRYLREAGVETSAQALMAQPHAFTARPASAEPFLELALSLAKGANAAGQYQTAYNIARQVDDIFPAGADVALQPLGVRDDYTSLTWLGGETALVYLGRARDAMPLFDRYARGGRSLQVMTKGNYWAGRAATTAGQLATATSYFERAATVPETFYGQLALERLGRPVPAPAALPGLATAAQRASFQQKGLVRAITRLGEAGRRDEQTLFIRALSESLGKDADRVLAAELGTAMGRPDIGVWTARSARIQGATFYYRPAFPSYSVGVTGRDWSLTHGITRQESSFDRNAVSGAGARGMMQLMTATAREQAGKMGLPYDADRLTSDVAYNMDLGSAYFARLVAHWGGSYPLAVASYNAGAGNVRKWVAANGDPRQPGVDVIRWIEDIPFSETRGYVQRVLENSVVYDRLNPTLTPAGPVHLSQYLGKSRPG